MKLGSIFIADLALECMQHEKLTADLVPYPTWPLQVSVSQQASNLILGTNCGQVEAYFHHTAHLNSLHCEAHTRKINFLSLWSPFNSFFSLFFSFLDSGRNSFSSLPSRVSGREWERAGVVVCRSLCLVKVDSHFAQRQTNIGILGPSRARAPSAVEGSDGCAERRSPGTGAGNILSHGLREIG